MYFIFQSAVTSQTTSGCPTGHYGPTYEWLRTTALGCRISKGIQKEIYCDIWDWKRSK